MADDMIHTQATVSFYNGSQINELATSKAGRPIYDDVEMIAIRWAGNTKSELHAPAADRSDRPIINAEDKSRFWPKWRDHPDFKKAYEAFKAGQAQAINGTPISELPFLTEAKRLELRAVNILSAEQLANLDAKAVAKFGMDMAELKKRAQAFLDRAAGAAVDAKHAEEMSAMQRQIDELKAAMTAKPSPTLTSTKAAKPAAEDVSASAFAQWDPADIRNWMKDADPTADQPHPNCSHATLVKKAEELGERLKQRDKVAA